VLAPLSLALSREGRGNEGGALTQGEGVQGPYNDGLSLTAFYPDE